MGKPEFALRKGRKRTADYRTHSCANESRSGLTVLEAAKRSQPARVSSPWWVRFVSDQPSPAWAIDMTTQSVVAANHPAIAAFRQDRLWLSASMLPFGDMLPALDRGDSFLWRTACCRHHNVNGESLF